MYRLLSPPLISGISSSIFFFILILIFLLIFFGSTEQITNFAAATMQFPPMTTEQMIQKIAVAVCSTFRSIRPMPCSLQQASATTSSWPTI